MEWLRSSKDKPLSREEFLKQVEETKRRNALIAEGRRKERDYKGLICDHADKQFRKKGVRKSYCGGV